MDLVRFLVEENVDVNAKDEFQVKFFISSISDYYLKTHI